MQQEQTPRIVLTLPAEFYEDLDRRIKDAVTEALAANNCTAKARYLTRKEVCQKLNISLPTLSRYISKGILTAQKIGTRVLFDESSLNECLQKSTTR